MREQIRVTRAGGAVSAVTCFCHTDGLPHYHGRYPLPGNRRLDELAQKLWQVFRRTVRPDILDADLDAPTQELLWEFKAAGLTDVQIDGHLILVSPGDARIPLEEAIAYTFERHKVEHQRLTTRWEKYGDALIRGGFSQANYDELMALRSERETYLKEDPGRVRDVMEVYTNPLQIVRGTKG